MKKIEITLYSFDELPENAKKKAIDDNRESIGVCESSSVSDDYKSTLDAIEEKFGITVRDLESHGYSRFRMTAGWDEIADDPKYLPRYLDRLSSRIHKGRYYSTPMHRDEAGNWHYKHKYSNVLSDGYSCCLTGTYTDAAVDDAMNKRFEFVRKNYTIREFIGVMLDKFCQLWDDDSNYCFTDEYVREHFENNDFTFLKNGKVFLNVTA